MWVEKLELGFEVFWVNVCLRESTGKVKVVEGVFVVVFGWT